MIPMNQEDIEIELGKLEGWVQKDNWLQKEFLFDNFQDAIEFVNGIARIAEELNHHPDILIHSWNKVLLKTKSHDEDCITNADFELIEHIEHGQF